MSEGGFLTVGGVANQTKPTSGISLLSPSQKTKKLTGLITRFWVLRPRSARRGVFFFTSPHASFPPSTTYRTWRGGEKCCWQAMGKSWKILETMPTRCLVFLEQSFVSFLLDIGPRSGIHVNLTTTMVTLMEMMMEMMMAMMMMMMMSTEQGSGCRHPSIPSFTLFRILLSLSLFREREKKTLMH